jgi:hypothetical protein
MPINDKSTRDSRRNRGLEDYELRDLRGSNRLWCLVFFLAYSLLVRSMPGINSRTTTKRAFTVGQRIACTTQSVFTSVVRWIDLQWNRRCFGKRASRLAFSS